MIQELLVVALLSLLLFFLVLEKHLILPLLLKPMNLLSAFLAHRQQIFFIVKLDFPVVEQLRLTCLRPSNFIELFLAFVQILSPFVWLLRLDLHWLVLLNLRWREVHRVHSLLPHVTFVLLSLDHLLPVLLALPLHILINIFIFLSPLHLVVPLPLCVVIEQLSPLLFVHFCTLLPHLLLGLAQVKLLLLFLLSLLSLSIVHQHLILETHPRLLVVLLVMVNGHILLHPFFMLLLRQLAFVILAQVVFELPLLVPVDLV